jgi:hypothetical protein
MIQQNVVFKSPEGCDHELLLVRNRKSQQDIDRLRGMESERVMHAYNSFLLDSLQTSVLLTFLMLSHVCAAAKLSETRND